MADTVNVTFVSSHSKNGGSESYLESLVTRLEPHWVRDVVCLEDGPLVEKLRARSVDVHVVPAGGGPLALVRAAAKLRALRPELVHGNGVKAALVAALAGVPLVWVKHDVSWDGPLASFVALRARRVVGVSRFVVAALPRRASIAIVPIGLELPEAGAKPDPNAFGLPIDAKTVLAVGLLNPIKGQRDLVEALPALRARVPEARLVLVGGDDASVPGERDVLLSRARELGVGDAVVALGHRADAVDLMRAANAVAVATPRGEGFGLVAVEALAVGTPVVGYAAGALPEVTGDCALLVAPGDVDSLADSLARALTDDGLRAHLARCGPERVRDRYSIERWLDAMRAQYREAA